MVRMPHADAWMLDPTTRELLDVAGAAPSPRAAARQPEKRLILAILEDAVGAFQKYVALHRGTPRHFRQVEAWMAANDTEWAFSFVNICEALDLDVARCRAGLARWRRRQEAGDGLGVTVGARVLRVSGTRDRLHAVGGNRPRNGRHTITPRYRVGRELPTH
jgi:hypothetical protein